MLCQRVANGAILIKMLSGFSAERTGIDVALLGRLIFMERPRPFGNDAIGLDR